MEKESKCMKGSSAKNVENYQNDDLNEDLKKKDKATGCTGASDSNSNDGDSKAIEKPRCASKKVKDY